MNEEKKRYIFLSSILILQT